MKEIPLNDIQYRFWLDNLLKSDNTYNVAYSFCIKGNLQIDVLRIAFERLIMEYEPFHATIQQRDMKPYFLVDDTVHLQFNHQKIGKEFTDEELYRIIDGQANKPFSLDKEYPCRFFLYEMPDRFILLTLFHHIVMDGLTMFDFCKRLSLLYNTLLKAENVSSQIYALEEFNSEWQNQYTKEEKEKDIDYWTKYLTDAPLHMPIPQDNSCEDKQTKTLFFKLGKDLFNRTKDFCRQEHTTSFRLFSGVWLTVMNYFLQTDDLILDHTVHLRPQNHARLLGSFVNNLPIRISMDKINTFRELLDFLQTNRHQEKEHQKSIYTNIISSLRKQKLLSETKELFNIGIDYPIMNHSLGFEFEGCISTFFHQTLTQMIGDMCLVIEDDEDFSCSIRYNSSIDEQLVKSMSEAFSHVLRQVIKNVHSKIVNLTFITEETKRQILDLSEISLHKTISDKSHQLFFDLLEHEVQQHPDKTALKFKDSIISYKELNDQINKIARSLLSQDLGGKRIGIAMKRGANLIIAALGILKSGGTYVPLDLANPQKRLSFIIQDCELSTVVVDEDVPILFEGIRTLTLAQLLGSRSNVTLPQLTGKQEAYIIYTSGTTGKPKGIPITHDKLYNLILNELKAFEINSNSIVLQYANVNFDASISEIFTTLSAGATLVIADEEVQKDPMLLTKLINEEKITCATIPPALLSILPPNEFPTLDTIVAGGESTPGEAISSWCKGRRFVNAYGPTENTIDTTICIMDQNSPSNDLGLPLAGVSCYVLDKNLRLLPNNVPGELYIGGLQLTSGYINRPDLNEKSFIKNPFTSELDARKGMNTYLYKSGDLVRRQPNGHLLFLGRTDFQVKIRGLRIELGEIENNLIDHPAIKQAFVTTIQMNGKKQIAAYVMFNNTAEISFDDLKKFLSDRVPKYMVPAYWLKVDQFPLNINGKIDLQSLPLPNLIQVESAYHAPRTAAESMFAHILSTILQVPKVGIDDDLFDLGINSIQIMEAVFELSKVGIHSSVSVFYKAKTIRKILNNKKSIFCFWGNEYNPQKPILLVVCGYPYYKPNYDEFTKVMKESYSLLILETYHEYFLNQESCTLHDLLTAYLNMLRPVLKDKPLFAITGLCIGGEIGLQLAYFLSKEHIATPKVFVIDGFASRGILAGNDFIEEPGVSEEVNKERNRITNALEKSFFFKKYDGETHICLAKNFSKKLRFAHLPEETDPIKLKKAYDKFSSNATLWKEKLPHCQIDYLNSDHWDLLHTRQCEELKQIIDNSI